MTTLTTWVFVEYVNQFTADEDDMYNLLTRDVTNEKVIKDILGRDDIGKQMFEGFVAVRFNRGKPFCVGPNNFTWIFTWILLFYIVAAIEKMTRRGVRR